MPGRAAVRPPADEFANPETEGDAEPGPGSFAPMTLERRKPLPGLTDLPRRLSRRGKRIGLVCLLALIVGVPTAIVLSERDAQRRDARAAAQETAAAREAARLITIRQRPHRARLPQSGTLVARDAGPPLANLINAYARAESGKPSGGTRCTLRRIEPGGRYAVFSCLVFDRGRSVLGQPFAGRVDLRRRTATWCAVIPAGAIDGKAFDTPLSRECIGPAD